MAISKGFRYKDKKGKVTDYEYGVNGSNVTQDSEHRLVTDEEKQTWNDKADLEDIPSGSAASHAVANNCTTTQAGSVLDARQGKVLMDKANQLSSELESEQNKTYSRLSLSRDHHDDYMQQAIDAGLDRTNAEISVSGFIAFSVWCIDGVYIVFCYRTENKDYAGFISKIGESKSYSFYRYNGQNSVLKEL